MTSLQRCINPSITTLSRRYFGRKKKGNVERQSAALVALIQSQQTQSVSAFIDANGPISTMDEAMEIQSKVATTLEAEYPDTFKRMGYKVGGTNGPSPEPFYGPFYDFWRCRGNEVKEKEQGLTVAVESEFVFRIKSTLNIEGMDEITMDDVYPLIDVVFPGLELLDPRIVADDDGKPIPLQYAVSDLCSTGGVVVGSESRLSDLGYRSWKEYDEQELREAAVEVYVDGDQQGIGYGREVMGSPLNALLFVYNALLKKGETIQEGQYVTTGTMTGKTFLDKGQSVEAVFENIGDVELKLV